MHNRKFSVAIFSHNMPAGYSGGRYHAWVLAEALASQGWSVDFYSNNYPECFTDFLDYPGHSKIRFIKSPNFLESRPEKVYDYTILVPIATRSPYHFLKVEQFAYKTQSKLILLNFESGNWFRSLFGGKLKYDHWRNWQKACSSGAIILSSNKESEKFAMDFYNRYCSNLCFINSFPAVNNISIDKVRSKNIPKLEKTVTFFVRFNSEHKGGKDLMKFFNQDFKGYTFRFLVGVGSIIQEQKIELYQLARKHDIKIELFYGLSDEKKFEIMNSSSVVVFPSYFEGFGYPPVEARALNVPVVAYDLPVIREVNGDEVIYVRVGDVSSLVKETIRLLDSDKNFNFNNKIQSVESYGEELCKKLTDLNFSMSYSNLRRMHITITANILKLFYPLFHTITKTFRYFSNYKSKSM